MSGLTWENDGMALGRARSQQGFQDPRDILGDRLREGSLYRLLADHGQVMFGDGYFADLYSGSVKGQPTVPARVVATVMVLQASAGLSGRAARLLDSTRPPGSKNPPPRSRHDVGKTTKRQPRSRPGESAQVKRQAKGRMSNRARSRCPHAR